jgi:hypothetical protein
MSDNIPALNPLTQDHLAQIRRALDVIAVAEHQADMAQQAGIDVTVPKQQLADSKAKLLAIKNVYFPGA